MQLFLETLLVFISTEIDDFLVFVVLFAVHKNMKSRFPLFSGRLFAIVLVAALSAFAAFLLSRIPENYLRYIGFVPIAIGILSIFKKDKDEDSSGKIRAGNFLALFASAFLLTLASSGDNLGIYIPFFLDLSAAEKILSIVEIALLNVLWTLLQIKSSDFPVVQKLVKQAGKVLVPVVFILLGLSVLVSV